MSEDENSWFTTGEVRFLVRPNSPPVLQQKWLEYETRGEEVGKHMEWRDVPYVNDY